MGNPSQARSKFGQNWRIQAAHSIDMPTQENIFLPNRSCRCSPVQFKERIFLSFPFSTEHVNSAPAVDVAVQKLRPPIPFPHLLLRGHILLQELIKTTFKSLSHTFLFCVNFSLTFKTALEPRSKPLSRLLKPPAVFHV